MPRTKNDYVRTIRLGTENDIAKLRHIETSNVPIYDFAQNIEAKKMADMSPEEFAKTMRGAKAKNIKTASKSIVKGFVDLFTATAKEGIQYENVMDLWVVVVACVNGQKAMFKGQIVGINDPYIVGVKVESGDIVLCPNQENADCWLFV